MNRTQFTFYESFYKAIARIKKKTDQADAYNAIIRLALYSEEPDLDMLPDIVAVALENIIPNIVTANKKAENGKRGGEKQPQANAKQTASKPQANSKQTASEKEKEIEIEKEIDIKKEKKESKHKYGQYKNVLLTDDDMEKLKAEFPDYDRKIENLSEYIAKKGDKYKNHLAVIRSWARKDEPVKETKPAAVTGTADIRKLIADLKLDRAAANAQSAAGVEAM